MTSIRTATTLLVVILLVVGVATPVVATDLSAQADAGDTTSFLASTTTAANNTTNGSVNVSVGPQLSTVISVTSNDVETDIENSAFELEYEAANESAKAKAIADRAEALQERAESIRADYREATRAFDEGELTRDQYAQRLATLNARATNVLESADRLRSAAENVSALRLRAEGLSTREFSGLAENLSAVTGAGPTALLHRFTGETEGEIELETADGLKIEVENEDGEVSRELSRDRDDDNNISVDQTAALTTARGALSTPDQGVWILKKASIHPDSGYYKFEFSLTGANNTTGEAEVRIDGSTGDVFRVEEEIEPREDEHEDEAADEREDADDDDSSNESDDADERELTLLVTSGTPGPGETITVRALSNGEPSSGVDIELNGWTVGTTDANGTVSLSLPTSGAVEIRTASGDEDAELEFDFGEDENALYRDLSTSVSADNGTVTVTVTYQGSAVSGATVEANGDVVGTTDSTGTVTFPTPNDDELEIEITKGEFEADLAYTLQDGAFVQTEDASDNDEDSEADDDDSDAADSDADETEDDTEDDDSSDSDDSEDDDSSGSGDDTDDSDESDVEDDDSSGSDDTDDE